MDLHLRVRMGASILPGERLKNLFFILYIVLTCKESYYTFPFYTNIFIFAEIQTISTTPRSWEVEFQSMMND